MYNYSSMLKHFNILNLYIPIDLIRIYLSYIFKVPNYWYQIIGTLNPFWDAMRWLTNKVWTN